MRLIVTPNCQLPSPYGLYGDSKYLKSNRQWEHAYRSRLDVVRRNWPVDVNLNTRFIAIVDTRDANERPRAAIHPSATCCRLFDRSSVRVLTSLQNSTLSLSTLPYDVLLNIVELYSPRMSWSYEQWINAGRCGLNTASYGMLVD